MRIDIVVPDPARRWHSLVVERLAAEGHVPSTAPVSDVNWPITMRAALEMERRVTHRGNLSRSVHISAAPPQEPELTIDLTGTAKAATPTLRIAFDGSFDDATVPTALAAGHLVDVDVVLDGRSFESAAPMVDNRTFTVAAVDDIFARAVTVLVKAVRRFASGDRATMPLVTRPKSGLFPLNYVTSALPRITREVLRRQTYRFAHWRVGYRLNDGPGVADIGELGTGWSVLPDDGSHFYADPFPFEEGGRHYVFVEDYSHATRKAVISVTAIGADGVAGPVEPVLEEPHHLSYPQVFAHDGAIFMLPEASASGKLTLYRAERFPHQWVPVANLLDGGVSDATLLAHGGSFWLFATDRDGGIGSTSDTLVVFHAASLIGPWIAHDRNPILIDRRRARPGGAAIAANGKMLLPIQDGSSGYGSGLGLSEIVRLDVDDVVLGEPRPILGRGDFPYPQVHTLNRLGRLEVIDGIAAVRKR
jgi:hypothetical protein